MATQSIPATENRSQLLTTAAPFHAIPAAGKHLFTVTAGVGVEFAVSVAQIMEKQVQGLLTDAVCSNEGLVGDRAFMASVLLDMAGALRVAAGQVE